MKKGYLIPLLIIAILAGYLVLQKKDRRHYTLPEPPAVDMKTIDRLTVEKRIRHLNSPGPNPDGQFQSRHIRPTVPQLNRC